MALYPLSEFMAGTKRLFVALQGKKSNNSYEDLKTDDKGSLRTQLTSRVVVITDVVGQVIPAGTETKVISLVSQELVDYAYIWLAVVPNSYKSFDASVQWMIQSGSAYTEKLPIFSASIRSISDWFEVKARNADIFVKNNHTADITYRITLFGVR